MAKQRHNTEPPSSKAPLMMLAVGALVVAGLVVWALTRTVEPAQSTSVFDNVATSSVSTGPANSPVPDTSGTPIASVTAPITATSTAPRPSQDDSDSVVRISVEDLREKVKAGTVTIIDVRDSAAYQQGHIPASINLPFASIDGQIDMIPQGKEIVTYCACPAEESSVGAALILKKRGINNVSALYGGITAWRNLGLPIDTGR